MSVAIRSIVSCEVDFRPGGKWRIVHRDADGDEIAFFGEYLEIVRPERIVWTFGFEGMPGPPAIETYRFTEADGKTTLTSVSRFDSIESRDAAIASGMEKGAAETLDRLEALLSSLRS